MDILRDQIRKKKIRNGFRFQLGRKRVSPVACACSWESTAAIDVRSDLHASSRGTWLFAVSTSGSIDRSTILLLVVHAIGHREGSVSYVEESSCLEQGMIGDDKDFSGKVCVKWKDTEFERQVRSESLIPRGGAIRVKRKQPYRGGGSSPRQPRSRQTPQEAGT